MFSHRKNLTKFVQNRL